MAEGSGRTGEGFDTSYLFGLITSATNEVKKKLEKMKGTDQINIADMFEMQMLMNKLSQLSEMSAGVISASNQAISSMARNIKA